MALREDDLERYLDDDLPVDERRKVERALAADPALRAELQLRKELDTYLRNDEEAAFLNNLEQIGERMSSQTPTLPAAANSPRRSAWKLVLLVLAGVVLCWWLYRTYLVAAPPTGPLPAPPQQVEPPSIVPVPPAPTADPRQPAIRLTPDEPATPEKEPVRGPDVGAHPIAAFAPNPVIERAAVQLRGAPYTLVMSPVPTTLAVPTAEENASVLLTGRVAEGDTPPELLIHLLSNREADYYAANYLTTVPVRWTDGPPAFRVKLPLPTQPGRYYWMAEEVAEEAIIRVGSFIVE